MDEARVTECSMTHPTKVYQVNAFANQVAFGSPTGVVEHADNLDSNQMVLMARLSLEEVLG